MKSINVFVRHAVVLFVLLLSVSAGAEENKQNSLESLLGKYEGTLEVHMFRTLTHEYQTEIVSVDKVANTLSLTVSCRECEEKHWKRNNCKITEIKEGIKFVCKSTYSEENYTVNEGELKITGFGKKWPYSVNAKKVAQ